MAGGRPLFLVEWQGTFLLVAGDRASALRKDPTRESIERMARFIWTGHINVGEFLWALERPGECYGKP